jgi:hypothetical protein
MRGVIGFSGCRRLRARRMLSVSSSALRLAIRRRSPSSGNDILTGFVAAKPSQSGLCRSLRLLVSRSSRFDSRPVRLGWSRLGGCPSAPSPEGIARARLSPWKLSSACPFRQAAAVRLLDRRSVEPCPEGTRVGLTEPGCFTTGTRISNRSGRLRDAILARRGWPPWGYADPELPSRGGEGAGPTSRSLVRALAK